MTPFFTIVIPTLNEEQYIGRILRDLVHQKKSNFEVIVVDGSSKDKTKTIIKSFSSSLPLRLIEIKPNLSAQKNMGAREAQGNYIIFIDADMSVSPTFTRIAEKQVRQKKGFIFMPYVIPIEKKEFPEVSLAIRLLNRMVELSQVLKKPFSTGPCMIWQREIFLHIGGFEDIFGEDHHIIRKAAQWGIRVRLLYSVKVRFSLRRMKKDGRLKLMSHFILSHIYLLFNEKLKGDVFSYTMGGQVFSSALTEKDQTQLTSATIVSIMKRFFKGIVREF